MQVNLLHNRSLPLMVDKDITLLQYVTNAKFLEPYDERTPVIRFRGTYDFDHCNYISVVDGDDHKYYFVTKVVKKSPSITNVYLDLDLLYTYRDFIKSLKCLITRTRQQPENGYESQYAFGTDKNTIKNDIIGSIPLKPYKEQQVFYFTNGQTGSNRQYSTFTTDTGLIYAVTTVQNISEH